MFVAENLKIAEAQRPGVFCCTGVYCHNCGYPLRPDQLACNECGVETQRTLAKAA